MEQSQNYKITIALTTLRPKAVWILNGDDYANLEWLDKKQTMPTWAEVEAEINNPTPDPSIALKADLLNRLGITESESKLLLS
jgi:hypothetical protein